MQFSTLRCPCNFESPFPPESMFDYVSFLATTDAELEIAALTSSERTHWAKVRKQYFVEGSNKDSIDTIDEALFVVWPFKLAMNANLKLILKASRLCNGIFFLNSHHPPP